MKKYTFVIHDEIYRLLEEEYEIENKIREEKGLKKITKVEFLSNLLYDAIMRRRKERVRQMENEARRMEEEAMKFVRSFRNLELLSLLGVEDVKVERMEW